MIGLQKAYIICGISLILSACSPNASWGGKRCEMGVIDANATSAQQRTLDSRCNHKSLSCTFYDDGRIKLYTSIASEYRIDNVCNNSHTLGVNCTGERYTCKGD